MHRLNPDTKIELLIPDFMGKADLIRQVMATHPHVAGHNMETVRRLTPSVRSVARYEQKFRSAERDSQLWYHCQDRIYARLR